MREEKEGEVRKAMKRNGTNKGRRNSRASAVLAGWEYISGKKQRGNSGQRRGIKVLQKPRQGRKHQNKFWRWMGSESRTKRGKKKKVQPQALLLTRGCPQKHSTRRE